MTIIYRVSNKLSVNPNPLGTDKKQIIDYCFKKFKRCITDQELVILSDGATLDKGKHIQAQVGNVETFYQQLDYVCNLPNEDKVFLVEDDYDWRPEAITRVEEALDTFEIVSPYDHPGHYTEPRFITQPKMMRLIDDQVWREAPSTTLTFACRAYIIKQNIDLIKSFGVRDHELFTALRERGLYVYVPVPSLATHLVTGVLSPGWLITQNDLV